MGALVPEQWKLMTWYGSLVARAEDGLAMQHCPGKICRSFGERHSG